MYKVVSLTIKILLLSLVLPVQAIELDDLYQVKIGVKDQSVKERNAAALVGFKEVLVRKSGSNEILESYVARQSFLKVTSFLQRYSYERIEPKANQETSTSQTESTDQFVLELVFGERLIDELIQQAGMPIWGNNRPLSILWLGIEKDFNRVILKEESSDETETLASLIKQQAKRRGLPIILPLVDLEDQISVSFSDIWGRFTQPVIEANYRYAADALIVGRIEQIESNWQGKFSYVVDGDETQFELIDSTAESVISVLIDKLAEQLCSKYCVVEAAESHQLVIQISNIHQFTDFKNAKDYLESLSSIRQVEFDKISGQYARFKLTLLGELQTVKDAIRLNNRLIEENEPVLDPFIQSSQINNHTDSLSKGDDLQNSHASSSTTPNLDRQTMESQNFALNLLDNQPTTNTDGLKEANKQNLQDLILYYRWTR